MREAWRASIAVDGLVAVGDLRRYEPVVDATELLGTAPDAMHRDAVEAFAKLRSVVRIVRRDDHTAVLISERGLVTLHLTTPDQAGAATVWYTGSRRHVEMLQTRASACGLEFAGGRLTSVSGEAVSCSTENDLYRLIGLAFVPPELRAGSEELEAAAQGTLPD